MARKVKDITVTAEGRDKGKRFRLTEMPALQAEKWATRALLAMGSSGIDLPDDVAGAGMLGIAIIGIRAVSMVRFPDAEPLMDEMLGCVQIVMGAQGEVVRGLNADDIEEVGTLVMLRGEVIELHVGFSIAAELRKLRAAATEQGSSITSMSPALSDQ